MRHLWERGEEPWASSEAAASGHGSEEPWASSEAAASGHGYTQVAWSSKNILELYICMQLQFKSFNLD